MILRFTAIDGLSFMDQVRLLLKCGQPGERLDFKPKILWSRTCVTAPEGFVVLQVMKENGEWHDVPMVLEEQA